MGTTEFHQVDAFVTETGPFSGNPAAVVPLDAPGWPGDGWMQAVAAEANLSETAFVLPPTGADGARPLRWFTPLVEVDLCGHATLASAHVLWETGRLDAADRAAFDTRSGRVTAEPQADGWIELDFPALHAVPVAAPDGLLDGLGVAAARQVASSRMDLLVELASVADVRGLRPDFGRLREVDTRGVMVTAAGEEEGCDFVSRFFGPRVGIDEDPVTGSAHCVLTPWWAERLGRRRLRARQLSARGGLLDLRLDADGRRVGIGGRAVTTLRGRLLV